ncbi:MAG: nucleotidyltransferase domain-containing protein [Acidobacteria bacterium]|nr:nucleotidyltransferase domain-containing protein [Acidobacteriota bacterium]
MTPKVQMILAELKQRLTAIYGDRLVKLVLFGSQARGDATAESDIDTLLVLRGPVDAGEELERTSVCVADLSLANDVVVSRTFATEQSFQHERSPLLLNIRREGVSV